LFSSQSAKKTKKTMALEIRILWAINNNFMMSWFLIKHSQYAQRKKDRKVIIATCEDFEIRSPK
jgi:hypothetical protein